MSKIPIFKMLNLAGMYDVIIMFLMYNIANIDRRM